MNHYLDQAYTPPISTVERIAYVDAMGRDGDPDVERVVFDVATRFGLSPIKPKTDDASLLISFEALGPIIDSEAVIVNISRLTPSLMQKIGVVMGRGVPLILICDERYRELPFRVGDIRPIFYEFSDRRGEDRLRQDLAGRIAHSTGRAPASRREQDAMAAEERRHEPPALNGPAEDGWGAPPAPTPDRIDETDILTLCYVRTFGEGEDPDGRAAGLRVEELIARLRRAGESERRISRTLDRLIDEGYLGERRSGGDYATRVVLTERARLFMRDNAPFVSLIMDTIVADPRPPRPRAPAWHDG